MNREEAKKLIIKTFENSFDEKKYIKFLHRLLKHFDDTPLLNIEQFLPDAFKEHITSFERIGQYTHQYTELDLLIVQLKNDSSLLRARSMQRNLIFWYLKREQKDAALVAFVPPKDKIWRLSLVEVENILKKNQKGIIIEKLVTPAKRYSYLLGEGEKIHTAQKRFYALFEKYLEAQEGPSLEDFEDAFSVEKVTEEFFQAYRYALNEVIIKSLDPQVEYRKRHSFAQQMLSRILFIYFLQRKGWLKKENYESDPNYLKNLWEQYKEYVSIEKEKKNTFYSVWLSSLFFGAFNRKSHLIDPSLPENVRKSFSMMPFLNGGLFTKNELDELGLNVPDSVFEWLFEPDPTENDKKRGFLEIFNFTIDESLPIDVEVAVDPEMLGRVYESLIAEEERGSAGIFYTPRVEIDLMCRLSLVEYLTERTNLSKDKIIDFVFNPSENIDKLDLQSAKAIKLALENVKIVDPAVGSASFLVGMMNILVDLHSELTKKIENKEENLFALKQKIILENLYGVDVKDWAVMVGELRLWLSLIIETDEKFMDIYTKPLLPNLSFKIRQGDSLVEQIGDVQISLRGELKNFISQSVQKKLKELMEKKRKFFNEERSANLQEIEKIEKLEQETFSEILSIKLWQINQQINKLNTQIVQLESQGNIWNKTHKDLAKNLKNKKEQIEALEKEQELLLKTLTNLKNKTKKDYFLWEIDFAEVFAEKGGFDIVIGNPPYVRQELIAPPLENQSDYTDEEWRRLKTQYKEKLITSVKNIWEDVQKIEKKCDLYVYFYFLGLSLLREGGVFCFINSNSWLDVGYGACLQEFLLKNMQPIYIIDNLRKRSFSQADVNTVIVLIKRPKQNMDDYTIKFIAFKKPFEEVSNAEVFKRIESYHQPVFEDEDFRLYPKTKKELLLEGVKIPEEGPIITINPAHLPYIGNKWGGKYLRAPEIYFKILEKGKGKLVRLGDIAKIEGYIHGFNVGREFPEAYFVESLEDIDKILLTRNSVGVKLFGVKNTGNSRVVGDILIPRMIGSRYLIAINLEDILGQKFYKVILKNKEEKFQVGLFLNSTIGFLFIEINLVSPWGQGAISANSKDIKQIPVLLIDRLKKPDMHILTRNIYPIFHELSFDPSKPIREQEPNPLPDRKALDDIVFDALGLTEDERKEVYWAVAELVKNRLEKARSVR